MCNADYHTNLEKPLPWLRLTLFAGFNIVIIIGIV
jgi:hypothetical protein